MFSFSPKEEHFLSFQKRFQKKARDYGKNALQNSKVKKKRFISTENASSFF